MQYENWRNYLSRAINWFDCETYPGRGKPVVKLEDGPQQGDYLNFEGLCPSPGKPQKGIILLCSALSSPEL